MKRFVKMVSIMMVLMTLVLACVPTSAMAYYDIFYYDYFMSYANSYANSYSNYYSMPSTGYYNGYNYGGWCGWNNYSTYSPSYSCAMCGGSGYYQKHNTGIGNSYYSTERCPVCN